MPPAGADRCGEFLHHDHNVAAHRSRIGLHEIGPRIARRAQAGEPRPRTGVLVASVAMTVLALLAGWLALAAQPVNYTLLGWVIVALAISVSALVSTVKKMRQGRNT